MVVLINGRMAESNIAFFRRSASFSGVGRFLEIIDLLLTKSMF